MIFLLMANVENPRVLRIVRRPDWLSLCRFIFAPVGIRAVSEFERGAVFSLPMKGNAVVTFADGTGGVPAQFSKIAADAKISGPSGIAKPVDKYERRTPLGNVVSLR
jgi:hypothetical protein